MLEHFLKRYAAFCMLNRITVKVIPTVSEPRSDGNNILYFWLKGGSYGVSTGEIGVNYG